ncbi:MAG: bifunctional hydroxymethylpyrimidine kinase/phosphomethylpyrimidine kinase [Nitrospirota bacterium]|nr:bifunctional hydroxymethylpyrimidine kinase/phosphomethylpyrimidine kinase [Nitrospirota bacterium]
MNPLPYNPISKNIPLVLSIAGSDPSGGAGIQGDIKAIQANGAFALSVITTVTAQNSLTFQSSYTLPIHVIEAQMQSLLEDFQISAVKIGMLSSQEVVKCVAILLKKAALPNLVIDPVMRSKDESLLLKNDALESLKKDLIPLSRLLTPNIPEAEIFTGKKIKTLAESEAAARSIYDLGCQAVLVKGGHLSESPGHDILFDGKKITHFSGTFIDSPHTHGTGCSYASAIATQLAFGLTLKEAITTAKHYITESIRNGLKIGHGKGPTDHFYFLRNRNIE